MRTETMIAVGDVEKSSAWYQELLRCRSDHGGRSVDRLVNDEGEILLMLHHWGAEDRPTVQRPSENPNGKGLVLYFRVDDLHNVYDRAKEMDVEFIDEPHYSETAHQEEFSVRDQDGYYITFCRYRV